MLSAGSPVSLPKLGSLTDVSGVCPARATRKSRGQVASAGGLVAQNGRLLRADRPGDDDER
jgi:hypothetical protein